LIRRVEVIVPAANEEQRIARCLSSIIAARTRLHDGEPSAAVGITVVLDSCTDATAQIAAAFGVRVVPVSVANVGAARRAGAQAVLAGHPAGEVWLASTDADSEVPAGWLTGMLAEASRGTQVVLGTVMPGPDLASGTRVEWLNRHHLREGHPHVHGANFGIRGDTYLAVGGWKPLATGEDVDLARRVAQAGHLHIARIASIPVTTSARWAGRAPRGFSSYLRALSIPAPSSGICGGREGADLSTK
jgi:glycosyltransferase involved in cell wall biosynthesis